MTILILLIILLLLFYFFVSTEFFHVDGILNLEKKDSYEQDYYKKDKDEMFLIEFNSIDTKTFNTIKSQWSNCFKNGEEFSFYNDTVLLVYYVGKQLAGYVGLLTSAQLEDYLRNNGISEHSAFGIINQHGLYMYNLCVFPEFRNKGIGNKLVEGTIKYANDNRRNYINLVVFADSQIPLKIYRKYKFIEYYQSTNASNGKQVLTMIKYMDR